MSARRLPLGVFVLRSFQLSLAAAVALASLWGLLGGCREQTTAPIDRNRPPETFITSAPGDSQTAFYRVALFWSGNDHDGTVVAYEVAVTESLPDDPEDIEWRRTQRTDSLVTFAVEETREVLGHRFYVRAIDDDETVDDTPAWIFFGARDAIPPEVEFLRALALGPGGQIKELVSEHLTQPTDTIPTGWGVTFAWTGDDGDVALDPFGNIVQVGSVASYSYRLLPTESEYLGGELSDTAKVYDPGFFLRDLKGRIYVFQVRAVDDGGLSGSGTVTRSFVWNKDPVSRVPRCLPPGGTDSLTCFEVDGETHFSGDTLPLPTRGEPLPSILFTATAYDPDPLDGDHSVALMEWRSVTGAIINPWRSLGAGEPVSLTTRPTGNYIAMVRSVDRLGRIEGTPDSVVFYVNITPRFLDEKEPLFVQFPKPGDVLRRSDLEGTGLRGKFLVDNPDASFSEKIRFGVRLKTPDETEVRHHHRVRVRSSVAYDFSIEGTTIRRGDTLWTPGEYILYVLAEDNKQTGGDNRGSRSVERAVPFTVIDE